MVITCSNTIGARYHLTYLPLALDMTTKGSGKSVPKRTLSCMNHPPPPTIKASSSCRNNNTKIKQRQKNPTFIACVEKQHLSFIFLSRLLVSLMYIKDT